MPRTIISLSIPDEDAELVEEIKKFRDKGGNLSQLVRDLLYQYFFGDSSDSERTYTKAAAELNKLKKQIVEEINKYNELLNKIAKLENKISDWHKDIEKKRKETEDRLKEEIREKFKDLDEIAKKYADKIAKGQFDMKKALRNRISYMARDNKVTMEIVVNLMEEIYPELYKYAKGILDIYQS